MKTSVEHIINNSIQLHVSGSVSIWGPPFSFEGSPFSFEALATAHASNEKGEPLNEKGEPQMITDPSIWSWLL